jgi:adenine-specific DNA methylase
MRQFWLAKKSPKRISLFPYVKNKKIVFKIVGDGYENWPEGFDPDEATVARAVVTCPCCRNIIDAKVTRDLFCQKKDSEKLIVVVYLNKKSKGKFFKLADDTDLSVITHSKKALGELIADLKSQIDIDPLPDENLPPKESHRAVGSQFPIYNILHWRDLFNDRQKLLLLTFGIKIKGLFETLKDSYTNDYFEAIISYLSISYDMTIAFSNRSARWDNSSGAIKQLYSRQILQMLWDYVEGNPFSESSGSFLMGSFYSYKVIEHLSLINNPIQNISQNSAITLKYPDNYFDAVFTDPPYYDNVPYSYLSDLFYVWLKRMIGPYFPDLFALPLTPKREEIVVYANQKGGKEVAHINFEEMLKKSFIEIYRILKSNGVATIVYAHKSTEGWETLINSLLESGLIINSAWPIRTEMVGKLNAQETASLMTSIYFKATKAIRNPTAFYSDVKEETKIFLGKKLDRLWKEGISGADFFIAAIGSSIEVFGKYESVIDYEGNVIRGNKLLEDVRIIVTDYAVKKILHNGFATGISDLTRFYVLCRWEFKAAKIPFDEANKLAHSCHIELTDYFQTKSLIKKDKEFVLILGPQDREIQDIKDSIELIDVLHYAIKLWEKGKKAEMQKVLNETGYAKSDVFFRVAQAIAETLPNESKEKKLLEGFLNLRDKISESFKTEEKEKDLFD